MAWDTELVEKLRYYINDIDSTNYTWTDSQLKKFILISASILLSTDLQEFQAMLGGSYEIDLSNSTITPDPTTNGLEGWSNLIVMKAACMIAMSEYKKAGAAGGYKIVDDKSTIDTTGVVTTIKSIADDYCGAFKNALSDFKKGNFAAIIKAVMSPFTSSNTLWGYTNNNYGNRAPRI